ncbi:MAG: polyketide synthase, partial [Acidobacteria bacterium]|nr:polyketide synthase [Acidobacteriota bacterium]
YRRAGVAPADVGYIEAHGTGTALGDPIEASALGAVLGADRPRDQLLPVGSVKSAIGHLEPAAGIAGLIKVLLAMRHKVLPPSINFQQLNGHIPLAASPFYVNTEKREWLQEGSAPRRAAVSSFGFSGTNAHVVIEEYAEASRGGSPVAIGPTLIVLSAKNRDRLVAQAAQLLAAVEAGRFAESELPAIAYTLQVGREAMECRLGIVVRSLADLTDKLQRVIAGDDRIEELFRGEVKRNKETLSLFADEDDLRRTVAGWIERQQYERLLKGWVSGLEVDWSALYAAAKPARLSLPLYPFARDRYWVSSSEDVVLEALAGHGEHDVRAEPPLELDREEEWFEEVEEEPVPAIVAEEATALLTFEEVLEEASPVDGARRDLRTVVCFLTGDGDRRTARQMAGELAPGVSLIFIAQSQQYERRSESDYGVVRADGATYAEALRAIAHDHGSVDAILYLWAVEDRTLLAEAGPIVHLVQAIEASQLSCPHLWLAGRSESHLDRCHLDSWIGFERSLPHVLPRTRVSVLDSDESAALFGQLWREAQSDGGSAIYRQGRRLVRSVRPTTVAGGETVLRTGGTYLITGGTGALGWLFARHLAARYEAKLILTGRSPLDEERQARIDDLRLRGTSVLYLQGDVCNADRMRELVQQASGELGPIHGVIHAAGIVDPRSLLERDLASFERVAGPKVAGTLALDEALRFQQQLDFIAYFSSSSAVLGDVGWCDYAVGSRFQLAYAGHATDSPRRIAIAWPLWEQGGMNFEEDASRHLYLASSGQRVLASAEGLEIFERLLSRGGASLVIAGQPGKVQRFLGVAASLPAAMPDAVGEGAAVGRAAAMKGWTLEQCVA